MVALESISAQMAKQEAAASGLLAHLESADTGAFASTAVVREAILQLLRGQAVLAGAIADLANAIRSNAT